MSLGCWSSELNIWSTFQHPEFYYIKKELNYLAALGEVVQLDFHSSIQ
jgi:hypothetical protein